MAEAGKKKIRIKDIAARAGVSVGTVDRVLHDRPNVSPSSREKVEKALKESKGDVVVLAGKGHETYQDIGGVKHPFDEKVVVRELLEEM